MFQRKIDEVFEGLPNVFGIADDILILEYDADGGNHGRTFSQVMQIYHWWNLKLNKNKCHFRCTKVPFCGKWNPEKGYNQTPGSCVH